MKKLFLGLILVLGFIVGGYCADPVYTDKAVIDKIEILEDGQIQIREVTKVFKDGVEISKSYWRKVLTPDQNLNMVEIAPNITQADKDKVKAVANVVWTEKIKTDYIAAKQILGK